MYGAVPGLSRFGGLPDGLAWYELAEDRVEVATATYASAVLAVAFNEPNAVTATTLSRLRVAHLFGM